MPWGFSVLHPQRPHFSAPITSHLLWKPKWPPPGVMDPNTTINQGWPCSQVTSAERWHKGEGWRPSAGDQAPCSELPYGMAWGTQVPLARGRGLGRGNPKDPLSPPTPHCVCDSSDGPWGVAWPAPPGWGTENSRVTWVAGCRGDPRRSQRWGHRHPSPLLPAVSTARNTAPAPVGHLPPAESVTTGPTAEDAELQGQA